jgi:hypothetical protein
VKHGVAPAYPDVNVVPVIDPLGPGAAQ